MVTKDKTVSTTQDILNDLIRINEDRIQGYEKAATEITELADAEIKSIFFQMAEESRHSNDALSEFVAQIGGEPVNASTASGKLYRAWMDVKATFSGDNTLAALQSCEFGEDAAQRAYRDALEESSLTSDARTLIENQQTLLRASHNRIKRYRDEYAAAAKSK
jgi:uncharacterized protein (TIGR02284 family)